MKMYGAYCKEQITEKPSDMSKTVERIDVVSNVVSFE